MNAADVVTVGSEYLGVDARNFHHNVYVLENPVDIESATLVRERKAELKRVGWFGTPAGLVDLRAVKTAEPIETITRGGDIEFDLKSIDRTLTAFDLLLLPVEHEQMESGQEREPDGEGGGARGPGARHRHAGAYRHRWRRSVSMTAFWCGKVRTGTARSPVFAKTSVPFKTRFTSAGQGHRAVLRCNASAATGSSISSVHSTQRPQRRGGPNRPAEALKDVALVTLAYRRAKLPASGDGISFGSRRAVAPEMHPSDYLELFDALWEAVASVEQEWVLFKPQGFRPTLGFAGEVASLAATSRSVQFFVVRSQQPGFPADEWAAYAKDLRGTLCQPRDPGLLLARRSWLMQQPWRPADCLSYWTSILLVQALSEGVAGVVATPVVLRDKTPAITNICSEYASWATAQWSRQVELPYPDIQWRRLSIDVFASVAERLPVQAAAAFALDGERSDGSRQWESRPLAPMSSAGWSRSCVRSTALHPGG